MANWRSSLFYHNPLKLQDEHLEKKSAKEMALNNLRAQYPQLMLSSLERLNDLLEPGMHIPTATPNGWPESLKAV